MSRVLLHLSTDISPKDDRCNPLCTFPCYWTEIDDEVTTLLPSLDLEP